MARHSTIRSRPSFKTGALNHSATLPVKLDQALSRVCCKKKIECWTQSGFQFPRITFETANDSSRIGIGLGVPFG
ncbi:MAG: hypothetical protein WA710_16410, partial [Pseudolabrys sp.]